MAISSPLLEASIDGAHGVLLSIQGGSDLGLFEINEAAQLVSNSAAVDANIIFGAVIDDALGDEVRVTVIAAGLDENRNGRSGAGTSAGRADSGGTAFTSTSSFAASTGSGISTVRPAPTPAPAPVSLAAPPPSPAPEASRQASDETPGPSGDADFALGRGNGLPAAVGLLSAPVPEGAAEPSSHDADISYSSASYSSISRPAHAELGKTFDVASTRRRPVVFEEDDDLDVPDFLK
jgi:cell division protein FtsZ